MKYVKRLTATVLVGSMALSQGAIMAMPITPDRAEVAVMQSAGGTTYYVDATLGSDEAAGTSPDTPWRSLERVNQMVFGPGDQILLKSGEMWYGSLQPKGSGTKSDAIVVDSYTYDGGSVGIGQGDKPILNGAGQVENTVWLHNVEFWELRNLEVTNQGATSAKGRRGINVTADEAFDQSENHYVEHIYVEDVYVHDVNGDKEDKGDGGILYDILSTDMNNPIAFKDILIEDCYVEDVSRSGIGVGGTKCAGLYPDLTIFPDEKLRQVMHQEVVIRNNYVERSGGDGIVPKYCYEPLVEYNVSQEASVNTKDAPNAMYNAAIWPWECYKPVFQYNEAFDTYLNGDGQAYDCDWSWGTLYQYNYSHDNEGGFMLVCLENTVDSVIRYNISQNDQRSLFMTSNKKPAYVYNNTFYIKEGLNTNVFSNHYAPLKFMNNIFYREGAPKAENWHEKQVTYDNNLYYGYSNVPTRDAKAIIANPLFKEPGTGGQGTLAGGPALETLHGYELSEGSPAINGGSYVGEDRLPALIAPTTKDFYGNDTGTSQVDLGAIDTMTADKEPAGEDNTRSSYNLYDDFSGMSQGPVWFYEHLTSGQVGQLNKTQEDGSGYWKHPSANNWALVSKNKENNTISVGASRLSDGIVTFVAPRDGRISLSDQVALQFPSMRGEVKYHIELEGKVVYPYRGDWEVLEGGKTLAVTDLSLEVKQGDRISFVAKYAGHDKPALSTVPEITYVDGL